MGVALRAAVVIFVTGCFRRAGVFLRIVTVIVAFVLFGVVVVSLVRVRLVGFAFVGMIVVFPGVVVNMFVLMLVCGSGLRRLSRAAAGHQGCG
ncbi:hypothetical protein [uncultured Alistipes sp.]|uniref:hypothetical protein n=1 Tax=uncultured Alistipes sp. TaxID=538949 RepID=UPI00345C1C37